MSKWHSILEYIQFPLKVLFIGTLLLGVGSAIVNPNLTFLYHITNHTLIVVANMIRYIGGIIIASFPLLVFIQFLSRKFESSTPVVVGMVSYFLINIAMMFFINTTFPSYYYREVLGIAINFDTIGVNLSGTVYPFNMGIFAFLFAYMITMFCYRRSRNYSIFGITSFMNHDVVAVVFTMILSIITGVALAFIWPYVVHTLMAFFNLIGNDITNPVNLLLYGIFERVSSLFGLLNLPRQVFWFSELGGTWLNGVGIKFVGDVAVWTAQRGASIYTTTAGSFTTVYYIINMFMIPAYYFGYFSLCSSRMDRIRYRGFIVIATLLSLLCGNPLPAEILMLVLSPMLYVFYLFGVGFLTSALKIMNIAIGYNFSEGLVLANPGSGLDLISYFRNPYLVSAVIQLLIVGVITGLIIYYLTRVYFKKYAFGLFQFVDKKAICKEVVTALGGLDNIQKMDSTPDKLIVSFVDREQIDYSSLQKYGAYMMLEAKDGYLIRFGNVSTIIREYVNQQKAKAKRE